MPSGIDHIVIAVPDPDAAANQLAAGLGIAFTGGGRHEQLGTFNRIAFLGDAYLELLGVWDARLARTWPVGAAALDALERGGGFATYALLEDDLEGRVSALHRGGSSIGSLAHGSRLRPDGDLVEWWAATPPHLGPEQPPFLIQHAYQGSEWGPEAMAARRAFVHPIGSPLRLVTLEIRSGDSDRLAEACATQVGLTLQPADDALEARLGAHRLRLLPISGGVSAASVELRSDQPAATGATLLGVRFEVKSSSAWLGAAAPAS